VSNHLSIHLMDSRSFLTETLLAVHSHTRLRGVDIVNLRHNTIGARIFSDISQLLPIDIIPSSLMSKKQLWGTQSQVFTTSRCNQIRSLSLSSIVLAFECGF